MYTVDRVSVSLGASSGTLLFEDWRIPWVFLPPSMLKIPAGLHENSTVSGNFKKITILLTIHIKMEGPCKVELSNKTKKTCIGLPGHL